MDDIALSRITLCEGHPVRMRRLRGGKMVVEGWNGVAWMKGPDAASWASGRVPTRKELKTLGLRADDQPR